jgi:hypothetical protein
MRLLFSLTFVLACLFQQSTANADLIVGGTAQFVFNNNSILFSDDETGPLRGPLIMDRHYGTDVETATASQLLAGIGGDPITVPGSGLVTLNANVNGGSVVNPNGRSRQMTNLDVDFSNVLASWGVNERIGVDSVLRTIVRSEFNGGVIGLGDYSIVNNAGTLAIVNNLSFSAIAFTLGNASFQNLGNGFSVSGDLLVGSDLSLLTGGFVPTGTNVGLFSMSVSAVPEPSSMALIAISSVGLAWVRRRTTKNHLLNT